MINKITLKEYLEFHHILENNEIDHKSIREEFKDTKKKDIDKLIEYFSKHQASVELDSSKIEKKVTYFISFITLTMFILGFFTGLGLLDYANNSATVNIVYFFTMLIFLPFLFSVYKFTTLFSPPQTTLLQEPLEMIFKKLEFSVDKKVLSNLSIVIVQLAFFALFLGTTSALFITLIGKYVSFGWESTLITPELMQGIVSVISFVWSSFIPEAVPSLEDIVNSHYFITSEEFIIDPLASQSWWKFLALSLFVWEFIPRIILVVLGYINLGNVLEKSILADAKSKKILTFMNESYISTSQSNLKKDISKEHKKKNETLQTTDASELFENIIGWNQDIVELKTILKLKNLQASKIEIAGAIVSSEKMHELTHSLNGSSLVVVNSYEPPMKDFLYFMEDLLEAQTTSISVYLLGLKDENYVTKVENIEIWKNKILTLERKNIGIYDAK